MTVERPDSALRLATAADVEAIVVVTNLAYAVERFFKSGPRVQTAEVRSLVNHGSFLVVDDDNGIAASVYMSVTGETGYLGLLSVAPARQGQGLGRVLTGEIESRCAAAGCTRLEITVVNLRMELFPFYERLGFRKTGAILPMPDAHDTTQPCHLVVMAKAITTPPTPFASRPPLSSP